MQFLFVRSASDIPTGVPVLGIEIPGNRPDLLERCTLGNIDPQHGGGILPWEDEYDDDSVPCAALACTTSFAQEWAVRLPADTVFVTPRVDLDAVAAMALLTGGSPGGVLNRQDVFRDDFDSDDPEDGQVEWGDVLDRVEVVNRADSFAAGVWPGPRPLPTQESPWPQVGGAGEVEALAAANWVCGLATPPGGNRLTLEQAVEIVRHWLLYGDSEQPIYGDNCDISLNRAVAQYQGGPWLDRDDRASDVLYASRKAAVTARVAVAEAIQTGKMSMCSLWGTAEGLVDQATMQAYEGASLAVTAAPVAVYTDASTSVLPTDSSAGLSYCIAPISILRAKDGRYSVAAFDDERINFETLKARMNELEPGWGGPSRMCSSPMGRASALTPEQVLSAVGDCLLF